MTNNEFIKQFYPDYVSPKCAECGCEIELSLSQIAAIVSIGSTKPNIRYCSKCKHRDSAFYIRGYNAKVMVVDELKV